MSIKLITTDDELRDCFTVYHELRPLLESSEQFIHQVKLQLLDYVIDYAKEHNCAQVHLDTGYQRNAAHKVYLARGFQLNCHHLALDLA
jgi:hypothetical protein